MGQDLTAARDALGRYGLADAALEPLGSGLINATWLVVDTAGERFVLQRVAPIFPAEINRDIDVVTQVLLDHGVAVPRVIRSAAGDLWVQIDGQTWRLLTWLPGDCHDSLHSAEQGHSAGQLLASFHRALAGLDHAFANPRLGVHDTARHLAALRDALRTHAEHPRFAHVAPVAVEILAAADALPELPVTPDRIVHGDPKINNMLFDPVSGTATAMVDLDTIGRMPLPLELGDAFRSWCNPAGEDGRSGEFSAALFAAALEGYADVAADWLTPAEAHAVVPATETIIVELAARFCADALNESYFGWDPEHFPSRGQHNEVRAAGQLNLARSFAPQRDELAQRVVELFGNAAS